MANDYDEHEHHHRIGDTATSTAVNWLNDNCVGSYNGPEPTAVFPASPFLFQGDGDGNHRFFSQTSVDVDQTMTEEELLNLKASRTSTGTGTGIGANRQTREDRLYNPGSLAADEDHSYDYQSFSPLRPGNHDRRSVGPPPSLPRACRKMGHNEVLYRQQYSGYVTDRIKDFRSTHNLPSYRSMTKEQQSREQKRVLDLLERLRRASPNTDDDSRMPESPVLTNQSRTSDSSGESSTDSEDTDTTAEAAPGQSMILLSPRPNEPSTDFPHDDVSEVSSIENVRRSQYQSPNDRFDKKRMASSSGKRGADTSRLRLDSDDPLAKSIGRLTLGDDHIFTSSQSPIAAMIDSPIRSSSNDDDDEDIPGPMEAQPDISFGSDTLASNMCDNDSLVETAMLPDKKVRWDFDGLHEKVAPTDVRLRQGAMFHLPRLPTGRKSFPDPFRFYPDALQNRLNRLCRWLNDHNERALILSMHGQHFIDVILKQGLAKETRNEGTESNQDGNVLIVAREKEDLEAWSRSFREGSAFSVLNHAMLPLKERKSLSGSAMAAQYDIVLTTYEAFKSPDVVVTLDENNQAKLPVQQPSGTWCTASQPQQGSSNKKLSFLHRLRWRKIVFVDTVGRKSYLAKAGTTRQLAAVAALAQSRLICFVIDQDDTSSGIKALKRSDKGSLNSIIDILHITDELPKESLRDTIVDFSTIHAGDVMISH